MSPRTVEQTQRIKDERRELILRAARAVFARKGLAATKISDIAAAAGVSYGLVYHYFPGKEAVYTALVEIAVRGALRVTAHALERDGTPWDRLRWLCEVMLAGVREEPEHLLVILQAYTGEGIPEPARAALARYGEQIRQDLTELIRQGQRAGQVAAGDPDELTLTYFATIQGLALTRVQGDQLQQFFPGPETVLRVLKA